MTDFIFGDPTEDCRMQPFAHFGRISMHHVFYKSGGGGGSVKETQEEQALAEIAGKRWQYYQDTYRPLEDEYMKQVNELNTDAARGFASGIAASSTAAEFGNARRAAAGSMAEAGINPASGKYQAAMQGLSDAQAASSTESKAMAKNSVDDSYVGGLKNISAIGRGQATTAQAGLSDIAGSAASKAADDAHSAFNRRAANINAMGTIGGAAAYGKWGKEGGE